MFWRHHKLQNRAHLFNAYILICGAHEVFEFKNNVFLDFLSESEVFLHVEFQYTININKVNLLLISRVDFDFPHNSLDLLEPPGYISILFTIQEVHDLLRLSSLLLGLDVSESFFGIDKSFSIFGQKAVAVEEKLMRVNVQQR